MPNDPPDLPNSRIDIYRYLVGFGGRTPGSLIDSVSRHSDKHDELYKITLDSKSPAHDFPDDFNRSLLDEIDARLLHIPEKYNGRIATAWDEEGTSYRLASSSAIISKPDEERKEGKDLSDNHGLTLNIISRVTRDIRNQDPEMQLQALKDTISKQERDRRERRLNSTPDFSPDFDISIQEAADWSENLEEFTALLNPNMMDGSDRNRTRLGRASMVLTDSHEGDFGRGDITIYRAVPSGETIETGDWVTVSEEYAESHSEYSLQGEGGIVASETVDASEVYSYHGDPNEQVFISNNTFSPGIESIEDLWISLGQEAKPASYPSIDEMIEEALNNYQQGKTEDGPPSP